MTTKAKSEPKMPVRESVLLVRVKDALKLTSRQIRKARTGQPGAEAGHYYIVDRETDAVTETNVNLEEFARRMKILKGWEVMKAGE